MGFFFGRVLHLRVLIRGPNGRRLLGAGLRVIFKNVVLCMKSYLSGAVSLN